MQQQPESGTAMRDLRATVGDRLVIKRHRVGEPGRDAEILEVRGRDGQPPYVVRWSDDGRIGYVLPRIRRAFVQHFEHERDQ